MKPERYQHIQALLQSALELEDDKREAFLREACAGDESLRRQVESLMISYEQAGSFLESPAAEPVASLVTNAKEMLRAGEALGPYRILSRIGSGGMGEVYLAEDTRLGRRIALKLLSASFTKDDDRIRRFRQEASAASALNHPNILTIYEVGQTDSIHFMATEFIEGETLRARLTRGPMLLKETLAAGVQIASALAAAHAAGIVHRDIKPENIMLRRDGYIKVLDFGLAKLVEKGFPRQDSNSEGVTRILLNTNPGMIMGTVTYMSPEQTVGEHVDTRTDIWSLGVVLYEMISGRVPFTGATMSHVMVSIQDDEPAPLARHSNELPAELEGIVKKALMKDREQRYQTAEDIFAKLKSLEQELQFKDKLDRSAQRGISSGPTAIGHSSPGETAVNVPNNLPIQLTPLIGRNAEALAVKKQLRREDVRLLTLTGPGGTGKTRLCLQVAADLLGDFPDGVFFVALAAINDPNLVASAIAQTLGVKEVAGSPLMERLKDYLRERQMLLAIDNFEQVVAAAPLLAGLLNSARSLKVLMTSRSALRITGEHEFAVPPLALPSPGPPVTLATLRRYAAVELFVERATAVKPDFALTDDNAPAVAEICARLDGLPLAIELAAARIKVLPPRALLARLESRLKLLMGGARDLPSRQQTMRGAIAWSYELLNDGEKKLFRRLSVFVGGCELEAAESVCIEAGDLEIDLLDGVASLIDKSLLQQKEVVNDEPRFTMLETITEYGLEQLTASLEAEELRRRHADFFRKLAEKAETELLGAQQDRWLDQLEIEHGNFRAAMRWAEENSEAEIGLRLTGALWRFWEMRGHLVEGRERLSALLSLAGGSTKTRIKALYAAGVLADSQCDYPAARALFQENLELYRKIGDKWGIANSANNLGIVALRQDDYATARSLYEESLTIWREVGNQSAVALSLSNLGNVADMRGDYIAAHAYYQESLEVFKQLQDARGVALSLGHMGDVALHQREYDSARNLYDKSLAILMEIGDKRGVASLLTDMGDLACERGDYNAARPFYEEALVIFGELGDVRGIAQLFEACARMAGARGRAERALRLAAAAATLRAEFGAPLSPDEESKLKCSLDLIRQTLGQAASGVAWTEGRAMPTEKAIQYALASDTV
ncbi:MAG: protein kinase domain-containing protein [Pyrinomonadaceae bacterium]